MAAGVYSVQVSVADDDGGVSAIGAARVIVHNPGPGMVTGAGAIASPAGALTAPPALSGAAEFAVSARYRAGATTPSGSAVVVFPRANLVFTGTSNEWLVIAGSGAQLKGAGKVNGVAGYSFLLTVRDSQIARPVSADAFRITIWRTSDGAVVYDNVRGAPDDLDLASPQLLKSGLVAFLPR